MRISDWSSDVCSSDLNFVVFVPSEIDDWLPWSLPPVAMMSVPSAIMQPGSVTTSIIRFGVQKLTLTPNQKVAPWRPAHSGFTADCASSALLSLSYLPARPQPMVMGKQLG